MLQGQEAPVLAAQPCSDASVLGLDGVGTGSGGKAGKRRKKDFSPNVLGNTSGSRTTISLLRGGGRREMKKAPLLSGLRCAAKPGGHGAHPENPSGLSPL